MACRLVELNRVHNGPRPRVTHVQMHDGCAQFPALISLFGDFFGGLRDIIAAGVRAPVNAAEIMLFAIRNFLSSIQYWVVQNISILTRMQLQNCAKVLVGFCR